MDTKELLNRLKAAHDGASDYRIAKILGVKPQTVSHWKTGRGTMGDEVAIRAAEALGLDAGIVLLHLHIERESGNVTFPVWKDLARRLEMAALPMVVGLAGYALGAGLGAPLV